MLYYCYLVVVGWGWYLCFVFVDVGEGDFVEFVVVGVYCWVGECVVEV